MIRFEEEGHRYFDERDRRIPGITDLLTLGDLIDDTWFTEESSVRGKVVHDITAKMDLGELEPEEVKLVDSGYKGYVMAWGLLMALAPHDWQDIEVPRSRPDLGFAGRCDRGGRIYELAGPTEIKTGEFTKAHPVQTALQAILLEPVLSIPAELQRRHCAYLKPNGKFKLVEFTDPADIVLARALIRKYC